METSITLASPETDEELSARCSTLKRLLGIRSGCEAPNAPIFIEEYSEEGYLLRAFLEALDPTLFGFSTQVLGNPLAVNVALSSKGEVLKVGTVNEGDTEVNSFYDKEQELGDYPNAVALVRFLFDALRRGYSLEQGGFSR